MAQPLITGTIGAGYYTHPAPTTVSGLVAGSYVQCPISMSGPQVVRISIANSGWSTVLGLFWCPDGTTDLYPVPAGSIFRMDNGQSGVIVSGEPYQYNVEVGAATAPGGFVCVVATSDYNEVGETISIASMELLTGSGVISTNNPVGLPPIPMAVGSFVALPLNGTNPQIAVISVYENSWTEETALGVFWTPDGTETNLVQISNDYVMRTDTGAPGGIASGVVAQYSVQVGSFVPDQGATPGAIYVAATGTGTGSAFLSIELKDCDMLLDPTNFGAVGNGIVDDTAAIQAAIDYGVSVYDSNNQGVVISFRAGIFKITQPLVMPAGALNLVFQGVPSATISSQAAPRSTLLFFPPASTSSLIDFSQGTAGFNPPNGLFLRDLGLSYNDLGLGETEYIGPLLNLSGNPAASKNSSSMAITRCSFYPDLVAHVGNNCTYLYLDGSILLVVSNSCFYKGNYAVQGVGTTDVTQYQGFQNLAKFCDGTYFAKQATAPIMNPGNAWCFDNCLVEPNLNTAAAFIAMEAGYTCIGLTIRNCILCDDVTAGTWVEFAGTGFYMVDNVIGCYKETCVLSILPSANGSSGIVLIGNTVSGTAGSPSNQSIVNFQPLSPSIVNSQFVFLGNTVSGVPGTFTGVIPVGSIYVAANNFLAVSNNTSFVGALSAVTQTTGSYEFVNLLPYDDATFANGFVNDTPGYAKYDWAPYYNITSLLASSPIGSMMLKAQAGGLTSMSSIWPSNNAFDNGYPGVPVAPGQMVTLLASFFPLSTLETVYIVACLFEEGSYTPTLFTQSLPVAELTLAWAPVSLTFEMPDGYYSVGMIAVVEAPSGTIASGEEHLVANTSIAVGNPTGVGGTGWVAPVPTTLLQANGVGLTQVGTALNTDMPLNTVGTGSVTVNDGAGGSGGLVVGSGAGSSVNGPIVAGSLSLAVVKPTVNYLVLPTDNLVECNATAEMAVILPDATLCSGRRYVIINTSAFTATVFTYSSGQKILTTGGTSTEYPLEASGNSISVISDGQNWMATSVT